MNECLRSGVVCDAHRLEDLPREDRVEHIYRALARIEELGQTNAELVRVNAELLERLAKLERFVSRNSGSSSTSPSKPASVRCSGTAGVVTGSRGVVRTVRSTGAAVTPAAERATDLDGPVERRDRRAL